MLLLKLTTNLLIHFLIEKDETRINRPQAGPEWSRAECAWQCGSQAPDWQPQMSTQNRSYCDRLLSADRRPEAAADDGTVLPGSPLWSPETGALPGLHSRTTRACLQTTKIASIVLFIFLFFIYFFMLYYNLLLIYNNNFFIQ